MRKMEMKKMINITLRLDETQINALRHEISTVQDLIEVDIELFESKYPTLFELWSHLD